MSMEHHELGPSKWPMWAQCPHFDSKPAGDDANEGTRQHEQLSRMLRGENVENPADGVLYSYEYIVAKCGPGAVIESERKLETHDYFGTADAVCGHLLFDFKSGADEHDYASQLIGYAHALMETEWHSEVECHVVFGRSKTARQFVVVSGEASERADELLERRRNKDQYPQTLGEWCGLCVHAATCPAMLAPTVALAQTKGFAEAIPELAHPSKITDPAIMAQALTLKRFVSEWCDSVQFHASEMAKAGQVIPGYRLQERKSRDVTNINAAWNALRTIMDENGFISACKLSIPKLAEVYSQDSGLKEAAARKQVEELLQGLIAESVSVSLVKEKTKKTKEIEDAAS